MTKYKVSDLSSGYTKTPVVQNISFELQSGASLIFIGKNGCGKTTLIRALMGLLNYDGSVELDGIDLRRMSRRKIARKIALLPQISQSGQPYSAFETVLMGRYVYGRGILNRFSKEDYELAKSCLAEVGLYELRNRAANELSGGQLQRLFFARALCQTPDILLLDEPTNHLDINQQLHLIDLLSKWREKGGIICGAMHDINLTLYLGGRVLLLDDGKEVMQGEASDVIKSDALNKCFDINVSEFMGKSFANWGFS